MPPPIPPSWEPLRRVLFERGERKLWNQIRARLRSGTLVWDIYKIRSIVVRIEAGQSENVRVEVLKMPERPQHERSTTVEEADEILLPPDIDVDLTPLIEKWGHQRGVNDAYGGTLEVRFARSHAERR